MMVSDTIRKADELVGQTIAAGRYEIVKLLGAGGMGAVYQARQVSMDRMVALKLIQPSMADSDEMVKRFHREMKVSAVIEHPNTIRVYDYGTTERGELFLAMEFLEGRTLSQLLKQESQLGLPRIVHIGAQIARALGAAHTTGVVHRDLKPDNVMLVDRYEARDFVKVLDFGIARVLDESRTQLTADGGVIGTPTFMSPEQALGKPADHRSDLYSLGVVLYRMAVGRVPFDSETAVSLLVKHAHEPPPPPSEIAPGLVDPRLESLILRLLAKTPEEQPQTAAEVAALLEALGGNPSAQLALDSTTPGPQSAVARRVAVASPDRSMSPAANAFDSMARRRLANDAGPDPSQKRPWVKYVAGGLLALTVIPLGVLVVERMHKTPSAAVGTGDGKASPRLALDGAYAAGKDPVPPANCQISDGKTLALAERALRQLHDAHPGAARPVDVALRDELDRATTDPSLPGAKAPEFLALLARAHLCADTKPEEALLPAREAVRQCPGSAYAQVVLGDTGQRARQLDEAEAAYKMALAAAPDYSAPRYSLGVLALRRNDAKAALVYFDEVVKKNPDQPNVYRARGSASLTLEKFDEAIADLEEATRRAPTDDLAWRLLGKARLGAQQSDAAMDAFCKAKALGDKESATLCTR